MEVADLVLPVFAQGQHRDVIGEMHQPHRLATAICSRAPRYGMTAAMTNTGFIALPNPALHLRPACV